MVTSPFQKVIFLSKTQKLHIPRKKGMWRLSTHLSTFLRWHYPDQVKGQKMGLLSQPANIQHP